MWPCSLTCNSAAADGSKICSVVSVVSVGSGVLEGGSGSSKNQYTGIFKINCKTQLNSPCTRIVLFCKCLL